MNAKVHRTLIIGLLLVALVVLAGCGTLNVEVEPGSASPTAEVATPKPTEEPAATEEPAGELPADVRSALEVAFGYILASDGPEFPALDSGWQVENVTPENLVGSTTFELRNGNYAATVRYPIVAPEDAIFYITAEDRSTSYRWEGTVNAQGEVVGMPDISQFEPATFRSDPLGFEFDYPVEWTVSDQGQIGDRGSTTQFLDGERVAMQMTIYLWDPQNDLAAYLEQRKGAWNASGMTLLAEEDWLLAEGHPAAAFTLETVEGEIAYFFLTTIGDRYLELSGSPQTELVAAVAHTVRLFEPVTASDAHRDLGCSTAGEGTSEWVACNVMDALSSRNLAALPGYIGEQLVIGYWLSEGITVPPADAPAELQNLLAADGSMFPLTFTVDQDQFPPLMNMGVEGMFGPDVAVAHIIYSEGWGQDGLGAALIFIASDGAGGFYWHGMIYSAEHFDK
jgi:hypothetical protein